MHVLTTPDNYCWHVQYCVRLANNDYVLQNTAETVKHTVLRSNHKLKSLHSRQITVNQYIILHDCTIICTTQYTSSRPLL